MLRVVAAAVIVPLTGVGCSDSTERKYNFQRASLLEVSADIPPKGDGKAESGEETAQEKGQQPGGVGEESDIGHLSVKHSEKCLDLMDVDSGIGGLVVQQKCTGTSSQGWKVLPLNSEYVQIVSAFTGLCLQVKDASLENGSFIQQAKCEEEAEHQHWKVSVASQDEDANDQSQTYVTLSAAHSGKCLDVMQRSLADEASVIQWSCEAKGNQLWSHESLKYYKTEAEITPSERGEPQIGRDISCESAPEESIEATMEWREANYGRNSIYSNFFTPLVHYRGSSYFVWIDQNSRPQVSKINKGKVVTVSIAADYKARQDSHNLYSLGIDRDGFIHITGDMQNGPNDRSSAYPQRFRKAQILYWVSKKPESVADGFDFHGDTARTIPAKRVNGIRFFTDIYGDLYSSAVVDAIQHNENPGRRGIGLYKYSLTTKTWAALGGKPSPTAATKKGNIINKVLFWEIGGVGDKNAWQGFFSYFKFDNDNRLHFATAVNTDKNSDYDNLILYAVSDDDGRKWKKADGTPILSLPLRAVKKHSSQAHLVDEGVFRWQTNVVADKDGRPAIYTKRLENKVDRHIWYIWDGGQWSTDSHVNELDQIPHSGQVAPGGSMILTPNENSQMLYCQESLSKKPEAYKISALKGYSRFTNIDEYGLRTTGVVYGVAVDAKKGKQSIIKLTFKPAPAKAP